MTKAEANPFLEMFEDPERVRAYSDGPRRFTPGFEDLHRVVGLLIRERVASDAQILIHGAGGGLEIEALAKANNEWQFIGVDPAKPMLDEAEARLGTYMERVRLHHGYIDTAPRGPFDAATSLLTLHFLEPDERLQTIKKILERLRPGAPFVAVHSSFVQTEPDRELWLSRYQDFAIASGVDPEMAANARQAVSSMVTMLEPEQDMEILREAGLSSVTTFYSALTWRGWIGYV